MPTLDETVWRQRVTLDLNLLTIMAIHGNLCLALRHPANSGPSTQLVAAVVRQLGEVLVARRALTAAELAEVYAVEAKADGFGG